MYTINTRILILAIIASCFCSCISDDKMNPDSNPASNFDLLWKMVDEKYCYLDYKKINWDSIGNVYRNKLTVDMTEEELFDVCADKLYELKDGHVNLRSDFNRSRNWDWFMDYPANYDENILLRDYLGTDFYSVGKLRVKNFDGVGYIQYRSFEDDLSTKNIENALKVLGTINGLIIDVRDNGGGDKSFAEEFASCFLKEKTLVGYLRYKTGTGHNDFSDWYAQRLEPAFSTPFSGPIVVLTNRKVYSAANIFVSYMSVLPNVTIMGDQTGGGGAMPLTSELYNGWNVRMSMDPFFTPEKEQIENGIKPDVAVAMTNAGMMNHFDNILEEAIKTISGHYYRK